MEDLNIRIQQVIREVKTSGKWTWDAIEISRDFFEYSENYYEEMAAIEQVFNNKQSELVAQICEVLGPPVFEGDRQDASFPDWAPDEVGLFSYWITHEHQPVYAAVFHHDKEMPFILAIGAYPVNTELYDGTNR